MIFDCMQSCVNWAKGIAEQFQSLGLPSPFSATRIESINGQELRLALVQRQQRLPSFHARFAY